MKWVVDTCVIIDILKGDETFSGMSADALDCKRHEGLIIAPLTYVELLPSFGGNVVEQDRFLEELGVIIEFQGDRNVVLLAHKAWCGHILRKRMGNVKKRPIADVLIGAYAMQKGGLITRNEDDFHSLFPDLMIYNPVSCNPQTEVKGTKDKIEKRS